MQEFIAFAILVIAIAIIWKHLVPFSLRLRINRVPRQAALKAGWIGIAAEKPEKAATMMTGKSGCMACNNCMPSPQQSKCTGFSIHSDR
jgi:hypothetical protein